MADMRPHQITARLRQMSQLQSTRGPVPKGVDMSPQAITARLRTLASLSEMCRRLAPLGANLRKP